MDGTYKGKLSRSKIYYTETEDRKGKGHPPFESCGPEWTPLLSELLLRGARVQLIQPYPQT